MTEHPCYWSYYYWALLCRTLKPCCVIGKTDVS